LSFLAITMFSTAIYTPPKADAFWQLGAAAAVEVGALAFWGGAVLVASVGVAVGVDPAVGDDIKNFGQSAWNNANDAIKASIRWSVGSMSLNSDKTYAVKFTPETRTYLQDQWRTHFSSSTSPKISYNSTTKTIVPTTSMVKYTSLDLSDPKKYLGRIEWSKFTVLTSGLTDTFNLKRMTYLGNNSFRLYTTTWPDNDMAIYGSKNYDVRMPGFVFDDVNAAYVHMVNNGYLTFVNGESLFVKDNNPISTSPTTPDVLSPALPANIPDVLSPALPANIPDVFTMPAPQGTLNTAGDVFTAQAPTIGYPGAVRPADPWNVAIGYPVIPGNIADLSPAQTISTPATNSDSYEDAKSNGVPTPDHSVDVDQRSLPTTGKPYSSKDHIKNGELDQRRYYGPDGKAETDIDYNDHGQPKYHPKVPHRHDFDWSSPKPRGPWYVVLTDKFPDEEVPVIYTYVNLVEDIGFGHEVVFTYNSLKYSITQSNEGWYFTNAVDYENAVLYLTSDDLLDQVRIDGETLQQVFDSVNVLDISIY
jgi:hypothetical protein